MTIAILADASGGDLTTYAGLQTAIANWLNRNDLDGVIPNLVSLAEADINRRLALSPVYPMMEQVPGTIAGEYENTPADLLKVLHIEIFDGSRTWKIDRYDQMNVSALQQDASYYSTLSGWYESDDKPIRGYTIIGGSLRFFPVPSQSYTYTLTYYQRVPPLTDTNASNWLLSAHPDVYLFGALAHANAYLVDQEKAEAWSAAYNGAIDQVLAAYPEQPDMAPMRTELVPLTGRRGFYW